MHAIRAAHAFDGTQFLPGGATVLVDGDRIVGIDTGRVDLPDGVEVTEYDGTVLPRLREHGVAVVTGVDSGIGPTKRHGNAWRVVGEMVDAGYPAAEALATATSLAADACGLAAETGRLAAGYTADILIVDGDLSSNISALGSPRELLIRGTRVALGQP
jgi:imidazolonepropionase-like amidohydrolase